MSFVCSPNGMMGLPVLKPDRARGLEARYADANEFIEEDAAVRVASAFWHELKATPLPTCAVSLYHRHSGDHLPPEQSKGWMGIEFGWECGQKWPHLRLRFIRVASLRRTVAQGCQRRRAALVSPLVDRGALPEGSRRYASSRASKRLIDACP